MFVWVHVCLCMYLCCACVCAPLGRGCIHVSACTYVVDGGGGGGCGCMLFGCLYERVCVCGCAKCYFVAPSILMCWILVCILPTVAALTSVLTQPCCVWPVTMELFTFSPQRIQRKTNSLRECKCHCRNFLHKIVSYVCCLVVFRFRCMSACC